MDQQPTTQELRDRWAAALKQRREAAGLSQRRLAIRAGINNDTISAIENGEHGGSDLTRIALARALGCEVHDLFTYPTTTVEVEAS